MEIPKKALEQALRAVEPASDRRSWMPALGAVRIEASRGWARLTCSDLEVTATAELEAGVVGEVRALVPVGPFRDAIKGTIGEWVDLEADGEGSLRVGAASIRTLPLGDLPAIAPVGRVIAEVDAAEAAEAFRAAAMAASRDERRPVLRGILFELEGPRLELTSTDSYRLHHVAIRRDGWERWRGTVPARAIELVLKWMGRRPSGRVQFQVTDADWVALRYGERGIIARLIDGEYPDYRKLEPDPYTDPQWGRLEVDDMAELRRIAATADRLTTRQPLVLELGPTVRARLEGADVAWSEVVQGAAWKPGAETPSDLRRVAINPRYLRDALDAAGGPVFLRDGIKPLYFGSHDRYALVMPVVIRDR